MNISDLSVLVVTLIPVWCFFLSYIEVESTALYTLIVTLLFLLGVFLLGNNTITALLKISSCSSLYVLFTIFCMTIFLVKMDKVKPVKFFALSLMLAFVAADFWEAPVFVYGGLGLFGYAQYFNWFYQVHHLYIVVMFYVWMKRTAFKFNALTTSMLILDLGLCFMLLPFPSTTILARIINLFCFGVVALNV